MQIKNFIPINSQKNLEDRIKDFIVKAEKIVIVLSDYDYYKKTNDSLYKFLKDIINTNPKAQLIEKYIDSVNEDELKKNQNSNSKKNFSSFKKIIYNNLNLLNNAINEEDKTLNDIIDESDVENIQNFLKEIQKELISLLTNIRESNDFEEKIKPEIKTTLDTLFNTILENINHSNDDGWKQFLRATAKFFINIFDSLFEIKKLSSLAKKNPYILAANISYEIHNSYSQYKEYKNNKYYYDFAYPLLSIISSNLYPIVAFCNEEVLTDALIIDDKIVFDFSSYTDVPHSSFYRNSFYMFSINEETKDIFDSFLEKKYEYQKTNNELLINGKLEKTDSIAPLKEAIQTNIDKLNHFFYAEYPDLNSTLLVEMILEKNNTQKINTTQMGKNYLFITNSPQLRNAGLCEYLYETKLGAKIEYRPKAPTKSEKLTFKDGEFPTKRDYSAYCIKMNVKEEDAFVLQLCPFIKLERKKYLDCSSKVKAYINSFFRLPKEIEEITEKEKENVEKYIKTFQDYLDNINLSFDLQKALNKSVKEIKNHSPLQIFLITLTLYVLQKEFPNATTYSYNYKDLQKGQFVLPEIMKLELLRYQSILVSNYSESIKFIFEDIYYYNENNKKIYIFLNKTLNPDKKENEVIYLDELAQAIFENDFEENEQSYTDFLKMLNADDSNDIEFDESLNQTEINQSLRQIMADNETAKLAVDITFFNIINQLFPFTEFFTSQPKCFRKMVLFFINLVFDKKSLGSLFNSFKINFYKELGIFYALQPKGNFRKINSNRLQKIKGFKKAFLYQIGENYYYFQKLEYATELKQSKAFSRLDKAKQAGLILKVKKQLALDFSKDIAKNISTDILKNFAGSFIDSLLPSNYDRLKLQYEQLIYEKFTYNYDAPLAVMKEDFLTFPMSVNSRFMSFDLRSFIFGSLLCTGGLNYYPSIACITDLTEAKDFTLKRLLSYLILDEKRSTFAKDKIREGKDIIDDYAFYAKVNSLEFTSCEIYKLMDEDKEEEYKAANDEANLTAIKAYNEAIKILHDYANRIHTNSKNEKDEWIEDRNKARRLLKNLNIIGQNNLKAMYVGVEESEQKDENQIKNDKEAIQDLNDTNNNSKIPPKFVGRLATTIIMENGLFIG